jgi:hypothetical protein
VIRNPAPDLTFNRQDYRLSEPIRSAGASVRPMERDGLACSKCDYAIRLYGRYVQAPNQNLHPKCAIESGLLLPVEAV